MMSKCANPACSTPFQYLREGRLFQFEVSNHSVGQQGAGKKPVRKIEHFWLCGQCASSMTLALEQKQKVVIVPIAQSRRAAAS